MRILQGQYQMGILFNIDITLHIELQSKEYSCTYKIYKYKY